MSFAGIMGRVPPQPPPSPMAILTTPGLIKCGYCGRYGALGSCESCGAPNAPSPEESLTPHVTGRFRPEFPPNRVDVMPSFWWRCFWFPHDFRWTTHQRTWVQQVCRRCGQTGKTHRKPAAPPAPPAWRNFNEDVY